MDCVICKEPMIILELDKVEIDYCLSCKGIWLDAGELEILLDDEDTVSEFMEEALRADRVRESEKLCPQCQKNMNELLLDSNSELLIDCCPDKHGLWFDRGELKSVIELFKTQQSKKIGSLLRELFPVDNQN